MNKVKQIIENGDIDELDRLVDGFCEESNCKTIETKWWSDFIQSKKQYAKSTNNKQSYNVKQPKFHIRRGLKKRIRSGE